MILCCVFFLSGVSALLFETLWFYQAGLALGNSVWAQGLVLASFMSGLAVGNGVMGAIKRQPARPLRFYAALETLIALLGVAVVYSLPRLAPLLVPFYRPFLDQPAILNPLRVLTIFPILLAPAAAMGATLPVLVGALCRKPGQFANALGQLYGWNTLGAVVGAIAGEAFLFRLLGIYGTAWFAALLNITAATIVLALAPWLIAVPGDQATVRAASFSPAAVGARAVVGLLAAAFLCGFLLLAFEVVWFRLLLLFVVGTSFAFSVMLAVVLVGIASGGLFAVYLPALKRDSVMLVILACLAGVAAILGYAQIDSVAQMFSGRSAKAWNEVLVFALPLMFPVAFVSGLLFTRLGKVLQERLGSETRAAGLLTLANTSGAMLGSALAAFVLLPQLGIEGSVRLLAAGYGIAAFLVLFGLGGLSFERPAIAGWLAIASLVIVHALFPQGRMAQRYVHYPLLPFVKQENEKPILIREGLTETLMYLRKDAFDEPIHYRLVTNSYSMSATAENAKRYMNVFVYLPVALHPQPKRALLISYGVGNTAKALTDTRFFETIDVVDISKDILEANRVVYPKPGTFPLDDPRVRVHVEDGRFFLQTTQEQFDVITGEPPPPKMAGIVSLYTQEYFQLMRNRLAPGGIVTYWFPVHSLWERDAQAIARAFCGVFEDCSLWRGSSQDWVLMGTQGATGPVSLEHFSRQWKDPTVAQQLSDVCLERPEQLGALFLADADMLKSWIGRTRPLSDAYPKRLTPSMPRNLVALSTYEPMMEPRRLSQHFQDSEFIQKLWPKELIQASVPWFAVEDMLTKFLVGDLNDKVDRLKAAHQLLAGAHPNASLAVRTPVLWLLDSSAAEQRAVDAALAKQGTGPALDYQLGVRAMADRNYPLAVGLFSKTQAGGYGRKRWLGALRLYALCLAGRIEEAQALARALSLQAGDANDQRLIGFLSETFGADFSS